MENKKIEIETTAGSFFVDMAGNRLIWKEDKEVIVDLSDAWFDNKRYYFHLPGSERISNGEVIAEIVSIPQLLDIDRTEFVLQYKLDGIDLLEKNDLQAKMLQPSILDSKSLREVTVEIAEMNYQLNFYSESFLPEDMYETPEIKLHHIDTILGAKKCVFLFDPESRMIARGLSDKLLAVEIPSPAYMDPIGYANKYGRDVEQVVLKCGPLKNHHVAKTMKLTADDGKKLNQRSHRRKGLGR